MDKVQSKKMYEKLMEEDACIVEEIRETDSEIIQAFQKYYKGTKKETECFRDEIFGIITKAREQSFYQGIRYLRK